MLRGKQVAILSVAAVLALLLLIILYLSIRTGFFSFYGNIQEQLQAPGQLAIPDLRGLTYQEAQQVATSQGFRLTSQNGTVGLVSDQSPRPHDKGNTGDTIVAQMDLNETKVPPANVLVGTTLEKAEQSITSAHLKFTVLSDELHAGASKTVSRVTPAPGSILAAGSVVTLYVWNLTSNS